jgi:hypothetical protein
MKEFSVSADELSRSTLIQLRRRERDLRDRVLARQAQVEVEGRRLSSDPLYGRLSRVLRDVRADLEQAKRQIEAAVDSCPTSTGEDRICGRAALV